MSELQLGLLGIGLLLVIGVLGFNKWQELRFQRRSNETFAPVPIDALMDQEPALVDSEPAIRVSLENGENTPSDADFTPIGISVADSMRGDSAIQSTFSKEIELIATIDAADGIDAAGVSTAGLKPGFASRIRIAGWLESNWTPPVVGIGYPRLQVGLLLVNRAGAVSIQDLEIYSAWLTEAAMGVGGRISPLDIEAARAAAVELDKFFSEIDIQIGVHIVAPSAPFPGTRIRAIAEAAGLIVEDDGWFRRRDDNGQELFRLGNEGQPPFQSDLMRDLQTLSIAVEFDVARSPGGIHSFNRFRHFIEHMAAGVGGKIVDDNRAVLDEVAIDSIARQLRTVYQAMNARGFVPGSAEAIRVFS